MKCLACKHGKLKPGRTTVTVEREGTTIVIRNVPANVCETCGEDYLEAAVASSLETVLQGAAGSGLGHVLLVDLSNTLASLDLGRSKQRIDNDTADHNAFVGIGQCSESD